MADTSMQARSERLANNATLTVIARLSVILVTAIFPVAIMIMWGLATTAYNKLESVENMTNELNSAFVHGIAPRIDNLEEDVNRIDEELRERTQNRFTSQDASALQESLRRELDGLRSELRELRTLLNSISSNRPDRTGLSTIGSTL